MSTDRLHGLGRCAPALLAALAVACSAPAQEPAAAAPGPVWNPLQDGSSIFANRPELVAQVRDLALKIRDETGVYIEVITLSFDVEGAMERWGQANRDLPKAALFVDRSARGFVRGSSDLTLIGGAGAGDSVPVAQYRVNARFFDQIEYPLHQIERRDWELATVSPDIDRAEQIVAILGKLRESYSRTHRAHRIGAVRSDRRSRLGWPLLAGILGGVPLLAFLLRRRGTSEGEGDVRAAARAAGAGTGGKGLARVFPRVEEGRRRFGGKYTGGGGVERRFGD